MCTTELGEVARKKKEFDARGVKVIGLSANALDSHEKWIQDINLFGNTVSNPNDKTDVQFPIVRD